MKDMIGELVLVRDFETGWIGPVVLDAIDYRKKKPYFADSAWWTEATSDTGTTGETKFEEAQVPDTYVSDGSTASYYVLPEGAAELQDLISYKNMNAQIGEIFRACYRYGEAKHSERLRDAKKIKFYAEAEIERLERYGQ